MKKQLLHIILAGLLALLPSLALAQSNERMLIYSKSGEILPYRVEHIDSIKFLTDDVNLTLNPTITPHPDGTTGKMKLKVGDVGGDVRSIKVILPESFMIAKMNDMQCLRLFTPEMAASMGVQIFNVEGGKEYDLAGMQQGYDYTALFLPYDEFGCPGNVKRVEFKVPKGPLAGDPQIKVDFTDITPNGYTATLKPNADVKGYFFLNDLTDASARDQMMQMFGIPDLKHYIVLYGTDFDTRKAHEGESKSVMNDFMPGTSYSVFVVLVDKDGQYSDVQEFKVTTTKKGTSETAHVSIEVKDITKTEATVVNTPDENTSSYRETIVEKSLYNEDEMMKYLTETPESRELPYHSDVYTWTWGDLKPGTAYYALAIAQNADGKWGPLAKVEFTTLSTNQTTTLPLAYLTEYNVNPEGTDFVTTQDLDVSGYFSYEDAVDKFTNITIAGKKYHLPSKEEWMAILPVSAEPDHVSFSEQRTHSDIREDVSIAGESISSTNDYQSNGNGSVYALRYKGTNYVSAWRYEYTTLNGGRVMKITCRSLQTKSTLPTLEEIAASEFWDTNNGEDVVRYFPAAGFIDSEDEPFGESSAGYYWSSTKHNMWYSWNALFGKEYACTYQGESSNRFSIRLFEDASK
ncbi:hypothetical protein [uncultured Porphyromonas sp.]|uniref:hypothetical protein n=1 Tax=uncultured Porphyromonas sp. TaxID=159274 RepID=UPI00280626FE|nr:hypothetical protein [uncultured Porphyromonas sp.]